MKHEPFQDILLSQRFLPEHGGSIRWMHEVYRRWPRPVVVITHNYYDFPPRVPEFPHQPQRPAAGDHVSDPNLKIERHDVFLHDWGLQSLHNMRRYWRFGRAVGRHLREHPGVCVHCTHALPEVFALWRLRMHYGKRVRIVCYAHGEEITAARSSRQLLWMMNRAYAISDVLIANSNYTANLLREHADEKKIHVVHPGVEVSEFATAEEAGQRWRREHGYEDRLIVLTLGRLDPRKNQGAVVAAIGRLRERFPNVLYVAAGEGRQAEALRRQAQELGLGGHVLFTGAVDGELRRALYGACDLFAMPAIRDGTDVEGFGLVFLEAGACGKPSVAGCEGGQADAVEDGKTGLVADGTNGQAVADAMGKLLGNKGLRDQLGAAARVKAREHDWPRVVQRTVDVVEKQG